MAKAQVGVVKAEICTAHSKRTGKPCTKPAISGGNVCRMHGGSAPQVKAAAMRRLAELVDPALKYLGKAVKQKSVNAPGMAGVKEILTRYGIGEPEKLEVTGSLGIVERLAAARKRLNLESEA
jgi:hypothetical protein